MRILMTADAVGGVWTYAMELTRELTARGHDVVLATMGPRPSPAQREEARHVRLVESDHELEWMQDPWRDVDAAGGWLLDMEREHAPDVVHLNGYAHAALPFRAPVLVAAHSCVLTWWRACLGTEAPAAYDEYRRRVARGLAAASLVVAPTRALLDAMRDVHPVPAHARVVPNGLDPRPYRVERKEPVVLAVGRVWDEAKDVPTLDAAAEGLDVRVVGDARNPDGANAAPLRHARPLGRLPRGALLDAYARAAVLAHPARYEPFGLAPLEGALSGCALVLADIPSLREVWGDAAIYAPPGDAAGLRRALDAVLSSPAVRADFAARARDRASRYTAAAMADAYERCYRSLSRSTTPEGLPCAS